MALAKNRSRKAKWVIVPVTVLVFVLFVWVCLGLVHYCGHWGFRESQGMIGMTNAIGVYICTHEGAFPGSFQDLVDSDIVRPKGEGWFYTWRGAMGNLPEAHGHWLSDGPRFRPENMIVAWGYEYREADTMPLMIHKKIRVTGEGMAMTSTKMLRRYMKQYKKNKKLRPE